MNADVAYVTGLIERTARLDDTHNAVADATTPDRTLTTTTQQVMDTPPLTARTKISQLRRHT